jgi:peptidyl-prolyl cis-trans isomerase D
MIVSEIAKIPAFTNQATGLFDKNQYLQALQGRQLNQKTFELDVADDLASRHFIAAATTGLKMPRIYGALEAAERQQTRSVRLISVNPSMVPPPPPPSEEAMKSYYKANPKSFEEPELRQVRLVRFIAEEIAPTIPLDDEAMKKMYEFRKDSLSVPERRSFVVITAKDKAAADKIFKALTSGQTPDQAAKAFKGTVMSYDKKPKTAVPDAKVAAQAFALKAGEISQPIEGSLSFAVVAVSEMLPGNTPTYEIVRGTIAQEYQITRAKQKMTELTEAYQDAHDKGEKMEAIAQRLGLKIYDLPPMLETGQTMDQNLNMSNFPEVLKTSFSLVENGESGIESLGQGQFFALKVVKVRPKGIVAYEMVKPQLAQLLRQQTWIAAVRAKADEASNRLKKGETLEAVAKSLGAPVQTIAAVDRATGPQALGEPLVAQIFGTAKGKSFQISPDNAQFIIGITDDVKSPLPAMVNALGSGLGGMQTQRLTQDLGSALSVSARKSVRLKTYPELASQALGITPEKETKSVKKAS